MWTKIAAFQSRSHGSTSWYPMSKLLWQRHHPKNYSAFLQNFLWMISNIMKLLSECQFWEGIQVYIDAHCQNCLSGKDMLKTTQPFSKSSYELYLICDRASKKGPSEHRIHHITKWYISWVMCTIFTICQLQNVAYEIVYLW